MGALWEAKYGKKYVEPKDSPRWLAKYGKRFGLVTEDAYNPGQPRDGNGRWTSGGGGGAADLTKLSKMQLSRAVRVAVDKYVEGDLTAGPEVQRLSAEIQRRKNNLAVDGGTPWAGDATERLKSIEKAVRNDKLREEIEAAEAQYEKVRQDYFDAKAAWKDGDPDLEQDRLAFLEEQSQIHDYVQQGLGYARVDARDKIEGKSLEEVEAILLQYPEGSASLYDKEMREVVQREAFFQREKRDRALSAMEGGMLRDARAREVAGLGLIDNTPPANGKSSALLERQVAAHVNEMPAADAEAWAQAVKGSEVAIAFRLETNGEAIAEQGFLNQHKTGKSGGYYDPTYRNNLESGLWAGVDGDNAPVYGFLTDPGGNILKKQAGDVRQYGDAYAILKPEMDALTTVTTGDSLNHNRWFSEGIETANAFDYLAPTPKLDPDPRVAAKMYLDNRGSIPIPSNGGDGRFEYLEAQVHGGGVSVSSIKEIRIPSTSYTADNVSVPEIRALEAFSSQGVPVYVFNTGGKWVTLNVQELKSEMIKSGDFSESDRALLEELGV